MDIQMIGNIIGIGLAAIFLGLFIWGVVDSINRPQWKDEEIDREIREEYEYQQRLKRFMEDE